MCLAIRKTIPQRHWHGAGSGMEQALARSSCAGSLSYNKYGVSWTLPSGQGNNPSGCINRSISDLHPSVERSKAVTDSKVPAGKKMNLNLSWRYTCGGVEDDFKICFLLLGTSEQEEWGAEREVHRAGAALGVRKHGELSSFWLDTGIFDLTWIMLERLPPSALFLVNLTTPWACLLYTSRCV